MIGPADLVDRQRHFRSTHQRVLARRHRRRSDMAGFTMHFHHKTAHTEGPGYDAELLSGRFKPRPLLDMQLEKTIESLRRNGVLAPVADAFQLTTQRMAVAVLAGIGEFRRLRPGKHCRADHRRFEAGTLFIGPVHKRDRPACRERMIVQGAHKLQPGKHAENTVETAAVNLGVEMAADENRLAIRVGSGALGEDIAHGVDPYGQACLFAPVNELAAHRRVLIGKRKPLQAALFSRADFGGAHQRRPQA